MKISKCVYCKKKLRKNRRRFCSGKCNSLWYSRTYLRKPPPKLDNRTLYEKYGKELYGYKKKKLYKIPCLKCEKHFKSEDKIYNRICKSCNSSNRGCMEIEEIVIRKARVSQ